MLRTIQTYSIAEKRCSDITSPDLVGFAQELARGRAPQTVANYLAHLGAVFAIARPAWGYPLDEGDEGYSRGGEASRRDLEEPVARSAADAREGRHGQAGRGSESMKKPAGRVPSGFERFSSNKIAITDDETLS
ncbi:hypothetical protein [Antarcticirhabdus aurantiaca]|uniref:Uncharacterized protein n=1 Tax=Antarcticirhabdus aurantiaca TaxID=2606717 RepID=A0ACD4NUP8_9HYPH|nr:hypothetical protein [Antarcticirhabdus aurantiaca]WAJ30592.1 hypothetical protein OXU80_10465 [Jeongeuplla avenae]